MDEAVIGKQFRNAVTQPFMSFLKIIYLDSLLWNWHSKIFSHFLLNGHSAAGGESTVYNLIYFGPLNYSWKEVVNIGINQTCFCQTSRMSHFGELPDVVLPKIAKKCQNSQLKNSQDLAIFVKSTSGSAEICNFRYFWQNHIL